MPKEIERKYLIKDKTFLDSLQNGFKIIQGYISLDENRIVRVRTKNDTGIITFKTKMQGITRTEFEYNIPYEDALEMLNGMCVKPLIRKTRFEVEENGFLWELDVFEDDFKGMLIAEVELESEDTEIVLPAWLGEEVTHDKKYYNAEMVKGKSRIY